MWESLLWKARGGGECASGEQLLVGGDKTRGDRWYEVYVPIADGRHDEHLKVLRKQGLIHCGLVEHRTD